MKLTLLWMVMTSALLATSCRTNTTRQQENTPVSERTADEENEINALRPPRLTGKKAPAITDAKWINRKPEEKKGRLTLLHFWSTGMPMPAYVDIPRFNKFAKQYDDKLQVIGLSPDNAEFITDIEPLPQYPYASAPETVKRFGIKMFCYCYLLDPEGKVIHECFPLLKGEAVTEELIEKYIQKYFPNK
ncbi:MAG: peroxiredoxin family protein [Odoribacter sp.]|nr:peroxiredoxin family protein [Odoribacter sp.]